jgi:hypothetical protein
MSLTWVSNNGTTWPLDGTEWVTVAADAEGLFEIPTDLVLDPRVSLDGSALVSARRSPRPVVLPFVLVGDVRDVWGRLISALAAGGTLRYTAPDGTRELRQVVLEAPDRAWSGHDLRHRADDAIAVSLLALDPWWYGTAVFETISLDIEGIEWSPDLGWNPDIPWNGGASVQLTVTSEASVSPVWTIVGEVDEVIVASGPLAWQWVEPLADAAGGTVDTRRGSRGPRLGSEIVAGVGGLGPIRWGLLSEQSRLFNLQPGANVLAIGVSGASSLAELTVGWEPRWLTP